MIRRHPCFTLFPYTTLFRSVLDVAAGDGVALRQRVEIDVVRQGRLLRVELDAPDLLALLGAGHLEHDVGADAALRSEEHTFELQSPDHLVCRPLLEKQRYSR